jgi:hypothetical protein
MNVFNIVIGGVILVFFILALSQPLSILAGVHSDIVSNSNTIKSGTDSSGNVVEVGYSFFGGDISIVLLFGIGLAFFIGFIIWVGRGGSDPMSEMVERGGF